MNRIVISAFIANFASSAMLKACGFTILLACTLTLCRVLRKEDWHWLKGLVQQK